ncbi:MAG: hypothetical protein HKN46_11280 [Acidimicrobiia bacterium]|nr:hypothetical protein [Acidimicrobiia bacterium]
MEFTLLGQAFMGVGAVWVTVRVLDRNGALSATVPKPWDVLLGATMVGLLVGRLWAMVAGGTNPLTTPLDIIFIRGGVDTIGATLGALGAVAWWTRSSPAAMLDALAVPALAGLTGWHAGCLVTGSCAGTETTLPWAIETAGGVGRHPVELYAAIGFGLAAYALSRVRALPPGTVAGLALVAAAGVRAVTEPLRLHFGSGLLVPYLVGIGLGVIGLVVLPRLPDRRPVEEEPAEGE